jgi:hypothetical protein
MPVTPFVPPPPNRPTPQAKPESKKAPLAPPIELAPVAKPVAPSSSTLIGSWTTKAQLIVPSRILRVLNLNPSMIETFTLVLPASPVSEQEIAILTIGAVQELTLVAGTGHLINLLPRKFAQHAYLQYIFIGNTWYCCHSRGTAI